MAQRRMFSKRITNSGRFLKMPTTSQALYFHLNMHADDDGVVEAFQVMRMTGFNDDDLKVLASKGFVKVLNEDLVAFIMDWREHNLIRADRKIDSMYKDLLLQIVPEAELLEPRVRADLKKPEDGRPVDDQPTAQVRVGKERLGQESLGNANPEPPAVSEKKQIDEIIDLFKHVNPSYKQLFGNTTERNVVARLLKEHGQEKLIAMVKILPEIIARPYAPRITTPYMFERKMGDLKIFIEQEKAKSKNTWTVI
jgi:hypothetical protein